jgi:long-chain fatty acid transport protein
MNLRKLVSSLVIAGVLAPGIAGATNGYFTHGYGLKSKGRAGVGTAYAEDAFGGANNPATMVFVGNRIDFGADLFSPRREASRFGSSPFLGPIDGSADSDSNYFIVPEFGYNRMLNPDLSLGITVYGNGGMNTDYPGGQIPAASACAGFNPRPGPYNLLCGNGSLGVDYMQLFIAPSLAYKVAPRHAIGISPLIAFHRFAMEGLQAFDNPAFSTAPGFVTNRGHDTAWGYGVRLGYYGQLSDTVAVGAAYSSKVRMGEFDEYQGLFAESGAFDIHENFNLGVALKATPAVTLGVDYQRINYSGTKTVGNPSNLLLQCVAGNTALCLGGANGTGFGWHDINVWKFGVDYQYSRELTLRGGFSHSDNPIKGQDVTFNILAPGVIRNHLSLGFTYKTQSGGELTVAYTHAFSHSLTAPSLLNSFTAPLPAGSETIKMYQNTIGIAYGWKM